MPSSLWWMMWSDMIFVASCPARFTLRSYPKFTIGNCAAEHLFPAPSTLERGDAEENDNTGELVPGDHSLPARTRHHRDVLAENVARRFQHRYSFPLITVARSRAASQTQG